MGRLEHTSHGMLFRGIVQTKEGEHLRKTGGISYSRLRELLFDKIVKLGFDPALFGMVCIAFWLVVPQQQPMLVCKTDYLSDMVAGNLKLPKMGMLRIQFRDD